MSDQNPNPTNVTPIQGAPPAPPGVQPGAPASALSPTGAAPTPPVAEAAPEKVVAEKAVVAPRPLNPYAAARAPAPPPVDPRVVALEASNAEHLSTLSTYAATELSLAPEAVRNAVKAIAGDDPSAQLKALAAIRANGLGAAPSTPVGATVVPVGATTGAAAPAPMAAPATNPDAAVLARYEYLKSKGATLLLSQFRSANAEALDRAEAARNAH